uniref:N-acetyltransferase domain-containing protein n=1 Tax=Roseihalotalea indica TaxID=2867963 RepID=A0AA49JJB0_9BACT|nr:hypothetical protein K4G66_11790 [Tunicatimonas sp. TK19036]
MISTANQKITLDVLGPEHIDSATRCIAATFSKGEPMSETLGITPTEFEYFARLFIEKTATEQMSVVAVNEEGDVIGATISEDYTTDPPAGLENISEKFNPIFQLLGSLGERYANTHEVAPGSHYHIFMCGVYHQYAHRKLAQKLNRFAEDLAREKQYRALICEATGRVSQFVVASQLGFDYVDEIVYHDFLYEEQPVFADIDSVKSCIVYHKIL